MKQKIWIKEYGIHVIICAAILVVAFGINCRISIARSHMYAVSDPIYTLLKEITETKTEGNALVLSGWGFDTNYYSKDSTCELILQDTETGEALWPKMKKNPEPAQIAERYTDGEDYSAAAFEGRLKADKLKDGSVYEILLRYTASYTDENGNEQPYMRTVTTDEFLYQGKMTEYNPKTFVAPEIAGTELEKELEGARLFHYFPEGMWVYFVGEKVFYIMEKAYVESIPPFVFPFNWNVRNVEDLPEDRREYGCGNMAFGMDENVRSYVQIENYLVWCAAIMPEKATLVTTGIYDNESLQWVLCWSGQAGDISNE